MRFMRGVNEAHGVVILDVVTEIGGPDAMELLTDVYRNGTKDVWKRWALLGLARDFSNDEDVLDTVFEWLQSGTLEQRRTAVLSLGYIGGEAGELALTHTLYEPEIAPQAVRALQIRKSVAGLTAGYGTDNTVVWEMVTDALLSLGDDGALPLIQIVQEEHPDYYEAVIISLQNSSRTDAKEILQAADYNQDGSLKD